jgi:tetratricopeptide (TPR) repeat protein
MDVIGRLHRAVAENRLTALVELAQILPRHKDEIEPWLQVELGIRSKAWMEELDSALFNGHNAALLIQILPAFYEVVDAPDQAARRQRLQQRAIQLLIKDKLFAPALAVLRALPERQPKQEAVCHEGLGDFRSAAECHMAAGNLKEALICYRSIPDLEAALKLLGEIGEHPAAESLQWISRLQQLVAERPEKFTKAVTSAEKKLLEEVLERALGVSRRKPVPRNTAKKKPPAPRKGAKRKTEGRGGPRF